MNLRPIYKFEWESPESDQSSLNAGNNGTERTTDNLENASDASEAAIEELAAWGRADDECEVTLVGHETL
jgi:hypothetical protein